MIIRTENEKYRPGEDDTKDQDIEFSCNSIYVVGAETRASLKDILKDGDVIS